jgi:hypothetical protein
MENKKAKILKNCGANKHRVIKIIVSNPSTKPDA